MPIPVHSFDYFFDKLEPALASLPDELRPTLNPPASEVALRDLADAVHPLPVPPELRSLLARADGAAADGPGWWAEIFCGRLHSAAEMAYQYRQRFTGDGAEWTVGWSRTWLEISHESHSQAGIELVDARPALVLDLGVSAPRLHAPQLTAMVAAAVLIINNELVGLPDALLAHRLRTAQREFGERLRSTQELYDRLGWGDIGEQLRHVKLPPRAEHGAGSFTEENWPPDWQ